MKMAEMRRNCELCQGEATTYCPSDNAYLCNRCDEKVHGANFLVARHVRSYVCPQCRNFDNSNRFSGTGAPHAGNMKMRCGSCSPHVDDDYDDDGSLSSSSSCVSSTGEEAEVVAASASLASSRRKRNNCHLNNHRLGASGVVAVDAKVEGILVNWGKRIGVEDRRVVEMAVELASRCVTKMTVLPFRVMLASAFCAAMRLYCDGNRLNTLNACHDLRRLEQISGVPAKLILATESRLARFIKRRRSREDHEEGWAEC